MPPIRDALDSGAVVRTHMLRPTWHFVAAEDLRWMLALTSAKVESAMAARHRQLELTSTATDRAHALLVSELADRRWMTRPELGARFAEAGLPSSGEQTGHLLMLAELRALICSGPLRGTTHTYGLVDDVAPSSPALDRPDAARQLTRRFFIGHGPATRGRPAPMDDADVDRDPIGAHRPGGGRIVDRADRRRIDVVVRARRSPTAPGRTAGVPPARVRRAVP